MVETDADAVRFGFASVALDLMPLMEVLFPLRQLQHARLTHSVLRLQQHLVNPMLRSETSGFAPLVLQDRWVLYVHQLCPSVQHSDSSDQVSRTSCAEASA